MKSMRIRLVWTFAAVAVFAAAAGGQDVEEGSPASGQSRQLQTAIMFYDRGDDMQAMDRFLEILSKGAPSERVTANEYLNLITHRMNPMAKEVQKPAAATAEPGHPEAPSDSGAARDESAGAAAGETSRAMPGGTPVPAQRRASDLPLAGKDLIRKEINVKLRQMLETSLKDLRSYEAIRVLMLDDGSPSAIAIPSSLLFASGINFAKGATRILDALTRMIFSLHNAQVVILPEGAADGDSKFLEMRQSMGISADLFSAGIAAPRVKVNLLNTHVDMPKALQDFKGVVLLFNYNRPLDLEMESSLGEESGPPITLGAYPQAFRPDRGEGAVIEFSVSDPPAGLASWRYQLNRPTAGGSAPLHELVGGGPVYHQDYWNGRLDHFGALLAPGRYECVLTATDGKNRTRTLHRWIQIGGEVPAKPAVVPSPPAAPVQASPRPSSQTQKPPIVIEEAPQVKSVELTPRLQPTVRAAGVRRAPPRRKAKAQDRPRPKAQGEPAARPAAGGGAFEVSCKAGTHRMTPEGKMALEHAAAAAAADAAKTIELTGFADTSETDAKALAERRAQLVAGQLINKYQIEPKRIQVRSNVSDGGMPRVEVRLVVGGQP